MKNFYDFLSALVVQSTFFFFPRNTRIKIFILALACFGSGLGFGQFISGYTAVRTSVAYTTLSGATQLCTGATTCPDGVFTITLPWSFNFNGTGYTTAYMSQNGFITFGAAPGGTVYTPLSTAMTGVTGVIAAHGRNNSVTTATHLMRHKSNGTSYSFEWIRAGTGGALAGTHADYMITLYQTTNVIEVWYRTPGAYPENADLTGQVGIRGSATSEYKNLTTLIAAPGYGGVNTATASWGVSNYTSVNNGKYTWTPPSFCTPPITQGGAGTYSGVTSTQCDISFTRGDGASGVLVVARLNATTAAAPATNNAYAVPGASTVFGSGSTTGTNNFVVYNGTANGISAVTTALTITNLTGGSTYAFDVYEYESGPCYKTLAYTFTVAIPLCNPPNDQADTPTVTGIGTTGVTLNWNQGNGSGGDLVIISTGAITDPTQNTAYTASSAFGSGSLIGIGRVVNNDADGTVDITNLIVNTTYNYAIYTFESAGPCYMTPALTGNFTTANGPMTYTSSTTAQVSSGVTVAQGTTNAQILQLQVVTGPGTSPALTMSSITFNTNGTTNVVTDLTAARIYYTGTSSTFAATTQFGADVTTFPGGSTPIVVTGSQSLSAGTNYFWVVYDASISATINNLLDGECTSINVGSSQTPSVTAPAGTRPVASIGTLSCAYTGSSQAITFATIVGATAPTPTLVASGSAIDDNNYPSQSIGFNFEYNGVTYTSFGINSNGFIWFGTGTPAALPTFPVISNASANLGGSGTIDGLVVACGADLWAHPHISTAPALTQINTRVSGVAPNRVLTIEWTGFHHKAIGASDLCWTLLTSPDDHRMDFQIRIYETATSATSPGHIEMVYRNQTSFCINTNRSIQIGLRGSSNAEFLTRANSGHLTSSSTTLGGANSTTISFTNTGWFNGTNVGVRFAPSILVPTVSPTGSATNTCPAVNVTLTGSSMAPVSPTWQWYLNGVSISGASSSTYPAATTGNYVAVASNAGCGRVSSSTAVTIAPCNVNITASAGANGSISPTGTVSVVYGANQGFTITPDACFQVADVLVDGVSQGAITTFTFTNVTTTHTIAASFVAATEICNGIDDDCDTFVDEGFDVDGDGYTTCDGDCDDNDSAVNPLATEVCNGIDDDCDSSIDEGFDVDGDTYTTCEGDCDDGNAAVYPGATEVCNGIDDDCDSSIDEGFDADGDGYTTCAGDCNDADAEIHPLAEEGCNGIDDNCDSVIDDGYDADGDGYTSCNGDCDNYNSALNPGATELCNGIDDDCDGLIDEGFDLDGDGYTTCNGDCDDTNPSVSPAQEWFADMDGDGYGSYIYVTQCTNPGIAGVILTGGDCDDTNPAKNPGATEICQNGIDDNCNNLIDELCNMPINNNYTAAIVCSSSGNAYPSCGALNGTVVDATISAESNPANVVTGEDVWYSFSALSTGCRIAVVPNGFNAVIELRNSSNVQMDVEDTGIVGETEIMNFNGLTVGQNYRIAVRNYDSALGAGTFTICAQHLMPSYCNDGSGNYQLCSNFKPKWTGANTYTFNFDPTGATPGSNTSGSSASSIPLSTAALSLQYGGTYDATIDAVYNLVDGDNVSEIITVLGTSVCSINLLPHASVEVKLQQRCPTTLLKGSVLQGKPFVCGATNFTVEFTPVSDCIGTSNLGLAFEVTTAGSSSLGLSFTTPQSLQNNTHYRVRYRPNFAYGAGVYGTPRYIFIGGSSYTTDELNAQNLNDEKIELVIEASLYPNPNDGEMLNINMTNVESNKVYMRVLDNTGRVVYSSQFIVDGSLNTIVVFEHPLASGLYAVELIDGNRVITEKMIVEK